MSSLLCTLFRAKPDIHVHSIFHIQAIQVKVDDSFHVVVRFYEKEERRIVSRWEFVPSYDTTNISSSFTAMRTVRESRL